MFKKTSSLALLALVTVLFSLSNLSWAKKSTKEEKQGYLGVYLQELTSDLKESLDLDESVEGVLISGVVEDSPAEKYGLEDGDVIISFDGKEVYSVDKLTSLVRETEPGSRAKIIVIRDGKKKGISLTVGDRTYSIWYPEKLKQKMEPFLKSTFYSRPKVGIVIDNLTEQLGEYFGVKDGKGVLITEVLEDSPAEEVGLKAGDVILEIDDQKVEDTGELLEALSEKEKGDQVELKVLRNKNPRTFSLTLKEDEWSKEYYEDMGKLKFLPKKLERIKIPEVEILKEYSFDEKKLKEELQELKKELKELKEELKELREELK